MLNRVPFAGSGWEMANVLVFCLILLPTAQLPFPQEACLIAIAATTIGGNQQFGRVTVECFPQ